MKNRTRKIFILMCAVITAFVITACGGSGNDEAASADTSSDSAQTEQTAEPASEETTDDSSDAAVTGKYATLQEFLEDDITQEQLNTQIESLEGSGITADVTAEDNKLIYSFTVENPDLAAAMDAATVESTLESQASTFEAIASSLKAAVEVENPVVVVRYLDNTGAEITSKEFAG
ncbi:MAG TPA: DUF4854 domain-containing protein [Candidatus Mediterraneibacter norfolkensis]|nr:DUF4854 domain-containing protein [Candidatus Mediterraneibacter norfolkensis]